MFTARYGQSPYITHIPLVLKCFYGHTKRFNFKKILHCHYFAFIGERELNKNLKSAIKNEYKYLKCSFESGMFCMDLRTNSNFCVMRH